ncbi:MAG: penicillin-binding protein 2 [Candidatus Pacebacteria bacterium]|nr:penicillin-binding protein 2 [Candidatus Paceibacterota bacterium]
MIAKKRQTNGISGAWRSYSVLAAVFLLFALVVGRLYYLQVAMGEHYRVWAQGIQSFSGDAPKGNRGEIFFAGGEPLAINKDFPYAYASPLNVKDKDTAAERVAGILGLNKTDLKGKFERDALYVMVKEKIGDAEVVAIKDAGIEGVYTAKKKLRYYPQGKVAAQLAGFVDENGKGRYGLEEYYDDELAAGKNIILNIDYNIQYQAEQMIAKACNDLEAIDGEAIVADPNTGAILAMAKSPNFDPNNYREFANENIEIFKNNSCQDLFEPGSVFKAITMASALNDGKVTPQTSYFDSGSLTIGPNTIYNYAHRSYGQQTMTNVLEHSINTGAAFAESRLGNEAFSRYVKKFGVMEPTGIDLPETYSSNLEFANGRPINFVTASYGQGIWMTSIQLIRAYSALANGGTLVQPSVVRNREKNLDKEKLRPVISGETAETIDKMLSSVVDNGFGKSAKVPGYTIAGKTGTAQMSWSTIGVNQRGYSDKTTQSFIGFFPGDTPKFLVLVKLKSPNVNTAEYSAIPVFKDLAKYVIYVSQLPPNEEIKLAKPAAISAAVVAATTTSAGNSTAGN